MPAKSRTWRKSKANPADNFQIYYPAVTPSPSNDSIHKTCYHFYACTFCHSSIGVECPESANESKKGQQDSDRTSMCSAAREGEFQPESLDEGIGHTALGAFDFKQKGAEKRKGKKETLEEKRQRKRKKKKRGTKSGTEKNIKVIFCCPRERSAAVVVVFVGTGQKEVEKDVLPFSSFYPFLFFPWPIFLFLLFFFFFWCRCHHPVRNRSGAQSAKRRGRVRRRQLRRKAGRGVEYDGATSSSVAKKWQNG